MMKKKKEEEEVIEVKKRTGLKASFKKKTLV